MADYGFNTNLGPQAQPGMSLSDMVNLARGVQAYQQAEQINPLDIQAKQEAVKQAKIGTQSAEMEFGGKKMQKFMDTVGARATDQTLLDAVAKKDSNKVKDLIAGDLQELVNHKVISQAEAMQAGARMLDLADKDINSVVPALKNLVTRAASPESRLQLQTPKLTTNAAGALVGANPVLNQVNVLGENPAPQAPSVTKQPAFGKNASDVIAPKQNPLSTQRQFATSANPTNVQAEIMKGQAGNAQNLYTDAITSLSNPSVAGYLPNQEYVAQKLLSYLKDPNVQTGPIADALAGKTNQATLTSKEQEILKLIQQRIQNLNPRTDADAQSKKDAYGSFKMSKEALSDIIRQDIGWIRTDMLRKQGIRNYGGNPNNPNLEASTMFNNEFSRFAENPILSQYIGIVGTGKSAHIDEHDEKALAKLFKENNLNKTGIAALEQARKNLVQMSNGGQ